MPLADVTSRKKFKLLNLIKLELALEMFGGKPRQVLQRKYHIATLYQDVLYLK